MKYPMIHFLPKKEPPPTERAVGGALLFRLLLTLGIKGGVVGVEILGVQMILGDAEGIGDFSISNETFEDCLSIL
jgi:hypothetical protein